MRTEIWVPIRGYEEFYQVSSFGRVKSFRGAKGSRILKHTLNLSGYPNLSLYINGKAKMFRVHRLVAIMFITNPENKPQVNHIDGNKCNNCVDNLEWCSVSENVIHSYKTGLKTHTEKQRESLKKSNCKKVVDLKTMIIYESVRQTAVMLGLKKGHLANMLSGRRTNKTNLKYYNGNVA